MTAAPVTKLSNLPALRSLARLADLRPVAIVDSREQQPLVFTRLDSVIGTLQSADYSFLGGEEHFGISRKSLPDLVSSCVGENRARMERHLHRLRGFRFARLLVIGNRREIEAHQYRSTIRPSVIFNTLAAWEARHIPVVWMDHPAQAAELVERWIWWFARQMVEDTNDLLRGIRAGEAVPAP